MHAFHNFVRRLRVIGARAVQQTHHLHVIHRDSAVFDSCSIDNVVEPAIVRLAVVVPTVEKENAELTPILLLPNQNSF